MESERTRLIAGAGCRRREDAGPQSHQGSTRLNHEQQLSLGFRRLQSMHARESY
jgi:hypothetical protein